MSMDQSKALSRRIKRYFHSYGGWAAVFLSPLFLASVAISLFGFETWVVNEKWAQLAQSIIPNLLGFTLGTYAILFSLMTNRLKKALKELKNSRGVTFLEEVNSTFFHFIFVQVISIAWSILYQGYALSRAMSLVGIKEEIQHCIGYTLFLLGGCLGHILVIYSLLLIIAAGMAVFRIALIVDPNPG